MTGCQVLRCPDPSADRLVSARFDGSQRWYAEERERALDAGERWDCTGREGSILMGPDLAPALADYLVGGRGNGAYVDDREDGTTTIRSLCGSRMPKQQGSVSSSSHSSDPPAQGETDPGSGRRPRHAR